MWALAYETKDSVPVTIEADTPQEAMDIADDIEVLWLQIGQVIIGKTIMGTWAIVW